MFNSRSGKSKRTKGVQPDIVKNIAKREVAILGTKV